MNRDDVALTGKSHIGNYRRENQDRILILDSFPDGVVLAIADGLGGQAAGGVAATMAVNFLENQVENLDLSSTELSRLLRTAGDRILEAATRNEHLRGMGTTLTAVIVRGNQAIWAHAGDSRLYRYRSGRLLQLTKDHRFIQKLIDSEEMSAAQTLNHPLRGVLDQCIGSPGVKPDFGSFSLAKGDVLVLTSDGLHDYVQPDRIVSVLDSSLSLSEMADTLIMQALDSGSTDNVSIVLGRVNKIKE